MAKESPSLVRRREARVFLEGPEVCREYVRCEHLWFGTSTLAPGATGGLDAGHPASTEVWFVVAGTVVIDTGVECFELTEGDVLSIPRGVPHTATNIGETLAILTCAGAPGE